MCNLCSLDPWHCINIFEWILACSIYYTLKNGKFFARTWNLWNSDFQVRLRPVNLLDSDFFRITYSTPTPIPTPNSKPNELRPTTLTLGSKHIRLRLPIPTLASMFIRLRLQLQPLNLFSSDSRIRLCLRNILDSDFDSDSRSEKIQIPSNPPSDNNAGP